ncbi:MAG TPA: DinB family protein [Chloroflexota bacterium]
MPGMVRTVIDERDGLLAYLGQQRDALKFAVSGLSDEQASSTPTPSALSLAGLIKHVTLVERNWSVTVLAQGRDEELEALRERWRGGDWGLAFRLEPGETLAGWLEKFDAAAAQTERIVRELPSMDHLIAVPQGVPWFPKDVEAWSARWVLLHMIEETARHAGHADIIREALDGSQALMLMAKAEGWADQLAQWMAPAEPA